MARQAVHETCSNCGRKPSKSNGCKEEPPQCSALKPEQPTKAEAFATEVATRSRKATADIEYLAEKAFWQAQNVCGFVGTLEDWQSYVAGLRRMMELQTNAAPKTPWEVK